MNSKKLIRGAVISLPKGLLTIWTHHATKPLGWPIHQHLDDAGNLSKDTSWGNDTSVA